MIYRAILFDLDDTLYDLRSYWRGRLHGALDDVLTQHPHFDRDELIRMAIAQKIYIDRFPDFLRSQGVEDEALIRTVMAEGLRDEGFTVIEAADAAEALAVLASGLPVDILFTDVRMPGTMDGLALARVVTRTRPDIGVIVTSGHVVDRPAELAEPILPKPYLIPEAVRRIRRILDRG